LGKGAAARQGQNKHRKRGRNSAIHSRQWQKGRLPQIEHAAPPAEFDAIVG
jgi:hypothetical protein